MGKLIELALLLPVVASRHLATLRDAFIECLQCPEAKALQSALIQALSSSRASVNRAFRRGPHTMTLAIYQASMWPTTSLHLHL